MSKKLLSAVVLILILAALIQSCGKREGTREQTAETAVVQRGDIVVKITESGAVEPVTTVDVKSEIAGEIKKLFVEEGDKVQARDKLALVQQESSQARQVAQARASLERARLDLEETERDLERQKELYQRGFIAKKEVENAEKSHKNSKIQYELTQKQLWLILGGTEPTKTQSLASKTLDHIIVRAPISGVVTNLNVEKGEMITSGTQAYGGGGTTIMTIADLSRMIVKAEINEVDIIKVKTGQTVDIGFDAIRGRVYQGRVKKIAPAGMLKQNIVVYSVEVEILGSVRVPAQEELPKVGLPHLGERGLAQLTEKQRAAIRKESQSLRKQGASRMEIQDALRKKLKEYGAELPEERPLPPIAPLSQPTEEGRTAIEIIKPGMTADLDIIIGKAENVLCVPKETILEIDGRRTAMLIKNGKPVPQPVVTGLEDDVKVEIKEGLKEGDKVVITRSEQAGQAMPGPGGHGRRFGRP
jgi:RND family efflux transporter MFP subunit